MTVWQRAALELLAIYTAARLVEVGASGLRAKLAWKERKAEVVPERWWSTMVMLHAFTLAASAALVLGLGRMPSMTVLAASMMGLAFATLLRGWVYLTLRSRWNVRILDPGTICTTGPYRFIRHPNYLAVIVELIALPVMVGAYEVAVFASLANALLLSLRIPFEEQHLCAQHPEYRDVMMTRPRFLPRLWPGSSRRHPSRRGASVSAFPAHTSRPTHL